MYDEFELILTIDEINTLCNERIESIEYNENEITGGVVNVNV